MIYVEACLHDIKSIFDNSMDSVAKHKGSAMLLVAYVKQAVELHERVNRYAWHYDI